MKPSPFGGYQFSNEQNKYEKYGSGFRKWYIYYRKTI